MMVDLETLGTTPNTVIIAIGAVVFDRSASSAYGDILRNSFYALPPWKQDGRVMDENTIRFWMKQDQNARDHILQKATHQSLGYALMDLKSFIESNESQMGKFHAAWSYGATFDHVILSDAFLGLGSHYPIWFSKQLCLRTVTVLSGVPRPEIPEAIKHHALHDAAVQAVWLQQCMKKLGV